MPSEKKVNVVGIAVGVTIPLILIGAAVGGFAYYKFKQRSKSESEIAEQRKKRKEEPTGHQRKKATEFGKGQAEKKMDNEIIEEIKNFEKQEEKQKQQA